MWVYPLLTGTFPDFIVDVATHLFVRSPFFFSASPAIIFILGFIVSVNFSKGEGFWLYIRDLPSLVRRKEVHGSTVFFLVVSVINLAVMNVTVIRPLIS